MIQFKVNQYLTEDKRLLDIIAQLIIKGVKIIQIVAPAGAGKTRAINELIAQGILGANCVLYFTTPRGDIARQSYNSFAGWYKEENEKFKAATKLAGTNQEIDFSRNAEIATIQHAKQVQIPHYLYTGTETKAYSEDTKCAIEEVKQGAVYATFEQLDKVKVSRKTKQYLVIDENHMMLEESTYRAKIMRAMIEKVNGGFFDGIIMLTASPIELLNEAVLIGTESNPIKEYQKETILCEVKNSNKKYTHKVQYKDEKGKRPKDHKNFVKINYIINQHKAKGHKGQILIYLNNFKESKLYADYVEKIYGLKCICFSSQEESKALEELREKAVIKGYDVVFTTKLLIAGINIENEVNSIGFLQIPSIIELIQFSNRPRMNIAQGINTALDVYIFETVEDNKKKATYFIKDQIDTYNKLVYEETKLLVNQQKRVGTGQGVETFLNKHTLSVDSVKIALHAYNNNVGKMSIDAKLKYIQSLDPSFIKGNDYEVQEDEKCCNIHQEVQKVLIADIKYINDILSLNKGLKTWAFLVYILSECSTNNLQKVLQEVQKYIDMLQLGAGVRMSNAWEVSKASDTFNTNKDKADYLKGVTLKGLIEQIAPIAQEAYKNAEIQQNNLLAFTKEYTRELVNVGKLLTNILDMECKEELSYADIISSIQELDHEVNKKMLNYEMKKRVLLESFQKVKFKERRSFLNYCILEAINTITAKKRANAKGKGLAAYYTKQELKLMLEKAVNKGVENFNKTAKEQQDVYNMDEVTKEVKDLQFLKAAFQIEVSRPRNKEGKKETVYNFLQATYKNKAVDEKQLQQEKEQEEAIRIQVLEGQNKQLKQLEKEQESYRLLVQSLDDFQPF